MASGTGKTYNIYATMAGYADASILGAIATPNGLYLVPMFAAGADPGVGNVNLNVIVFGSNLYQPMPGVSVSARTSASTQMSTTNAGGQTLFVLPNNTLVYVTASLSGYNGVTTTVNLTTEQDQYLDITLPVKTVTTVPTGTVLPGEVTVRPTQDPHDPAVTGNTNAKAQDMMNWLAMHGMDLIQLCFLVTILGLM